MRVCPRCSYRDPYIWRYSRYVNGVDFCEYADFIQMYPIGLKLEPGKEIDDDNYVYRRTRNGKRVYRQEKLDGGLSYYNKHGWTEKH